MKSFAVAIVLSVLSLVACAAFGAQLKPDQNKPDTGRVQVYVYRPFTLIG